MAAGMYHQAERSDQATVGVNDRLEPLVSGLPEKELALVSAASSVVPVLSAKVARLRIRRLGARGLLRRCDWCADLSQ
jgi:hypothetical protein